MSFPESLPGSLGCSNNPASPEAGPAYPSSGSKEIKEEDRKMPLNAQELTHACNRMEAIRKRWKKAIRTPYEELPFEQRRLKITEAMHGLVPANFTREYLLKQTGADSWQLSEEELQELSPRAISRLNSSFNFRSLPLWPWLLYESDSHGDEVEEYLDHYDCLASTYGLFPNEQVVENIPNQRHVDWRHRYLAAQLMFVQSLIKNPDIAPATTDILTQIDTAMTAYSREDIPTLQGLVRLKAPSLSETDIAQYAESNIWTRKEDLALMCVDRGLREVVVADYGVFRGSSSGYHIGQTTLAQRAIRSGLPNKCLRVAY